MRKYRPYIGLALSVLFLALCFHPQIKNILLLPPSQRIVVGEVNPIEINISGKLQEIANITVIGPSHDVFASQTDSTVSVTKNSSGYQIQALKPGTVDIKVNLWGYIPIKSMQIEAVAPRRVVVGGHSIGVFLQSQGIMVVGFAPITGSNEEKLYPGREQGIEIGDLILKVNGQAVYTDNDLAGVIDAEGNSAIQLTISRRGQEMLVPITPVHCAETDRYRIGLFIRDGVVGVGTLTFWDPDSSQYAALGHIIVDADTKQDINVLKGRVVSASIQAVKPGRPGWPGEKIGVFDDKGIIAGDITKNSPGGIFGKIEDELYNPAYEYRMEVAYSHQVKKGPAQILTVINGEDIEKFDIEIEKVYSPRQNGKDMVIRVTDPRLLSITGGIIQGMSGSPIVQDNHLVGAVTHVFLNDPQTGYGIFMDNILSEMPPADSPAKKVSTFFSLQQIPAIANRYEENGFPKSCLL